MPPRKGSSKRASSLPRARKGFGYEGSGEGSATTELNGRCWGRVSDVGTGHLQIADSEAVNSHAKGRSTRGQGDKN